MTKLFEFSSKIKPISLNHAVRHSKFGSYKSTDYKKFFKQFQNDLCLFPKTEIPQKELILYIEIKIPFDQYYTKKNTVAKKNDVSNFIKYIEDGLALYLGFNDSLVKKIVAEKSPGEEWEVIGSIYLYREI